MRANFIRLWPVLVFCLPLTLSAQDPFEIHVYEYEQSKPGQFTFEQHLNYVGRGTRVFSGTVAPTNDQMHLTFELTAGVTPQFSIGAMQLNAVRPGGPGLEYAGWRVLPHFYAPESWGWPLKLGLVTEFSFQKTIYEENARRVEIRPILEKSFGPVQVDVNPVFSRALHGPGVGEGWAFEPAVRAAYELNKRVTPSIEYYSSVGTIGAFPPVGEQVHLFYPGADLKISERALLSLGIGFAATPEGSQLIFKSRLELSFGRKD